MPGKPWSEEKRAEALALYAEHGPREASRRCGVPHSRIIAWAQGAGITCGLSANYANLAALRAHLELRRHRLAEECYATAEQLLAQVFEPTKIFHWDKDGKYHEHTLEEPTYGDKRQCVTSVAILIDKGQVLTGQATQRVETVSAEEELAEVVGTVDELRAVRERRAS